jgi:hypothetical protein
MPSNVSPVLPLSPVAQERFIARAAELNRTLGHMLRAWNGFKSGDAEHKPYWLDIYKNCIGKLELMHAEINYEGRKHD